MAPGKPRADAAPRAGDGEAERDARSASLAAVSVSEEAEMDVDDAAAARDEEDFVFLDEEEEEGSGEEDEGGRGRKLEEREGLLLAEEVTKVDDALGVGEVAGEVIEAGSGTAADNKEEEEEVTVGRKEPKR